MTVYLLTEIFNNGEQVGAHVVDVFREEKDAVMEAMKRIQNSFPFLSPFDFPIEVSSHCISIYAQGHNDLYYWVTSKELK